MRDAVQCVQSYIIIIVRCAKRLTLQNAFIDSHVNEHTHSLTQSAIINRTFSSGSLQFVCTICLNILFSFEIDSKCVQNDLEFQNIEPFDFPNGCLFHVSLNSYSH